MESKKNPKSDLIRESLTPFHENNISIESFI